jgi:hypothetical protein
MRRRLPDKESQIRSQALLWFLRLDVRNFDIKCDSSQLQEASVRTTARSPLPTDARFLFCDRCSRKKMSGIGVRADHGESTPQHVGQVANLSYG